jgi:hypothetical protein
VPATNPAIQLIRSGLAVIVGLISITLIVEPLEFLLVTLAHGGMTTDPYEYFLVRNRGWFLALKVIYNTGAATIAGYLTASIAGRAALIHGGVVAALQSLAFGYAFTVPELRATTPDWLWVTMLVATPVAILVGARLRIAARRRRRV